MKTLVILLVILSLTVTLYPGQSVAIGGGNTLTYRGYYPEGVCVAELSGARSGLIAIDRNTTQTIQPGVTATCYARGRAVMIVTVASKHSHCGKFCQLRRVRRDR